MLETENSQAFNAVNAQAGTDVAGDELVGMIAPAADGDVILVFHIDGEDASARGALDSVQAVLVAHGGPPIGSDAPSPLIDRSRAGLEISGVLYSARSARMMAALTMQHTGASLEEAAETFGGEFGTALPPIACAGWRWRSVAVVHELDVAGLPLRRFRLEPRVPRE